MQWQFRFLVSAITVVVAGKVAAGDRVDFSRGVRPILAQHCWTCHGPDENLARLSYGWIKRPAPYSALSASSGVGL